MQTPSLLTLIPLLAFQKRPLTAAYEILRLEALLSSHRELVNKLPDAKHIVTEKSGHNVPIEQPELVVDTIRQIVEGRRVAQLDR